MSACLTYSDVLAGTLTETATFAGTSGTYYSAILTGYDTSTSERTPSESAGVTVLGFLNNKIMRAPDNTITRLLTFTLPAGGTVTPKPMDRIEVSGRRYVVTGVDVVQVLGVVASYHLILQS